MEVAHDARIPSLADERGEGVFALVEERGDVVRLILQTVGIARPARGVVVLPHPLAVDKELHDAERRRVDAGAHGLFREREGAGKFGDDIAEVMADKLALEIPHDARFKGRLCGGGIAVVIGDGKFGGVDGAGL